MTYPQRIFSHIMTSHRTRFYRKEKRSFLDFIIKELKESGHTSEIITGGEWITSTRNLITKPKDIKYILTAHYDTPGKAPFGYSRLSSLFGSATLLFNIIFILYLFLSAIVIGLIVDKNIDLIYKIIFLSIIVLAMIPNKNNANDNTSGVVTLMYIANLIKKDKELKDSVMFIFTDKEESGLWGSKHVRKYLEENKVNLNDVQIINIDCVGNGDIPVVCYVKPNFRNRLKSKLKEKKQEPADKLENRIKNYLSVDNNKVIIKKLSSSDHKRFRNYNAINLSMMKKTKLFKKHYLPNIHTNKDKNIDLKNIEWFGEKILNYIKLEQSQKLENR